MTSLDDRLSQIVELKTADTCRPAQAASQSSHFVLSHLVVDSSQMTPAELAAFDAETALVASKLQIDHEKSGVHLADPVQRAELRRLLELGQHYPSAFNATLVSCGAAKRVLAPAEHMACVLLCVGRLWIGVVRSSLDCCTLGACVRHCNMVACIIVHPCSDIKPQTAHAITYAHAPLLSVTTHACAPLPLSAFIHVQASFPYLPLPPV